MMVSLIWLRRPTRARYSNMLSMGEPRRTLRDMVDEMRLEFHPDNPKIRLSLISFLLEAGVAPEQSDEGVDRFNKVVREMTANVTAGYLNYVKVGYELADEIENEIVKVVDGRIEDSTRKGKHTDDDSEYDVGGSYL